MQNTKPQIARSILKPGKGVKMMSTIKKVVPSVLLVIAMFGMMAGVNACDTWVALPDSSETGFTIFTKNSDRLLFDSQPLILHPRKKWSKGSEVDLGRLTVPQVEETYASMGSSPYWCWGYEEGINEYGVAIGNEGIYTRVLAQDIATSREGKGPDLGPTGMDLLRLGLERGKTAREALDVITGLVEEYGQFGSGQPTMGVDGAYDNSYIIADPGEAWVLETAGKHWIAKRFPKGTTSISNKLSITTDWDLVSSNLVQHALEEGWWPEDKTEIFDFEAAYSDDTLAIRAAAIRAQTRATCSADLLWEKEGEITPRWMMRIARDRSSSPSIDLDQTASSAVAILPNTADELPVFWWSPATPSNGCYVPFFVHGSKLPETVSVAGTCGRKTVPPSEVEQDQYSSDSYWWLFRDLSDKVNRNRDERNALVRAEFDALEKDFEAGIPDIMRQAVELRKKGRIAEVSEIFDAYTAECVDRVLEKVNELRQRFGAEVVEVPLQYQPYVGKYLPTHRDAEFTVLYQNGHLAVDIPPNPSPFELKEPDKEGKWYFTVSEEMAVSFERDNAGSVIVMNIHQGPGQFECVRAGVELPPGVNLDELEGYLGEYRSEESNATVEVFIQNNRLAMNVPGQVVYELKPPNEEGLWAFRIEATSAIKFSETSNGQIESMTYYRSGVVDDELIRIKD